MKVAAKNHIFLNPKFFSALFEPRFEVVMQGCRWVTFLTLTAIFHERAEAHEHPENDGTSDTSVRPSKWNLIDFHIQRC